MLQQCSASTFAWRPFPDDTLHSAHPVVLSSEVIASLLLPTRLELRPALLITVMP